MSATYRHPDAIVSGDWLETHLPDADLRVFDCTTYLDPPTPDSPAPYTVRSAVVDHDAGHIPGAGYLDLQGELSDPAGPAHLRFTMPDPETLGAAFARRGIGERTRVVLYSRTNMQWATRVWWMLRAIGFDNAAVLDGGFDRWTRDGRAVDQSPCTYAPATLTVRPRPDLFVGRAAVSAAMGDAGVCTLNALSADLHRGDSPRYGRPGRIPGSVNLPALDLQHPKDRTFLDADTVAAKFRSVGADPAKRAIVYCGGGIAATLDAFLMWQLGYDNVAVYDASMSEWARDPALPIETG